jgi:hypothetical protein
MRSLKDDVIFSLLDREVGSYCDQISVQLIRAEFGLIKCIAAEVANFNLHQIQVQKFVGTTGLKRHNPLSNN